MLKVIYSNEVKCKLKSLKDKLVIIQGEKKGTNTISSIVSVLDSLGQFPDIGVANARCFHACNA